LVLVTKYYCLRYETSHFVAYYDLQGHGGGIRPRLHTESQIASEYKESKNCQAWRQQSS
jgi:hypothetical protein